MIVYQRNAKVEAFQITQPEDTDALIQHTRELCEFSGKHQLQVTFPAPGASTFEVGSIYSTSRATGNLGDWIVVGSDARIYSPIEFAAEFSLEDPTAFDKAGAALDSARTP